MPGATWAINITGPRQHQTGTEQAYRTAASAARPLAEGPGLQRTDALATVCGTGAYRRSSELASNRLIWLARMSQASAAVMSRLRCLSSRSACASFSSAYARHSADESIGSSKSMYARFHAALSVQF